MHNLHPPEKDYSRGNSHRQYHNQPEEILRNSRMLPPEQNKHPSRMFFNSNILDFNQTTSHANKHGSQQQMQRNAKKSGGQNDLLIQVFSITDANLKSSILIITNVLHIYIQRRRRLIRHLEVLQGCWAI